MTATNTTAFRARTNQRNAASERTGRRGYDRLRRLYFFMGVIILETKEYVRPRNVNLAFRVSQEERNLIERRMKQAGMKNLRAYIVKQALTGHIIHVELDSVREMVRLLSNATNNINQIARRANQTGSVYAADLDEIRGQYDALWSQTKEILRRLSSIE